MKKWIGSLLAALLVLGAAGCAAAQPEPETGYRIYQLANPQSAAGADAITAVLTELPVAEDASLEEKAEAVVEAVLETGGSLWQRVELQDIAIQGHRVYVDLSRSYGSLTGIQLSLADYCITLSLTQLEDLASVTITAGGQELPYRTSQVLMEQDVLLSTMDDVIETVTVSLYFADGEGVLTAEERTLEVYEGETLAESTMAALLDGPQEWELHAIIPDGFWINGVRVEEGVCILSLPSDALALLPEEREAQEQILLSIAKTIYSWGTVDEIQLLVDGEPSTSFGQVPVEEVQFRPVEEAE